MRSLTLSVLRTYAIERSLFLPTTLMRAVRRLGFVQADPIRAPARAQDLILRLRVKDYCAGDLERRYAALAIDEDLFVNYGFLPSEHLAVLYPRVPRTPRSSSYAASQRQVLKLLRTRGRLRPRDVQRELGLGRETNPWGGTSHAATRLMDDMHRFGLLRVALRESGQKIYEAATTLRSELDREARADAILDLAVNLYAPVTARGLALLASALKGAAWDLHRSGHLKAALVRVRDRLGQAQVDGTVWYWPAAEDPRLFAGPGEPSVRLLAPFDPVVWDRTRCKLLFDVDYRFEAYTPPGKRVRGYYALPMLWGDRLIGWSNLTTDGPGFRAEFGYERGSAPKDSVFRRELDREVDRVRAFLKVTGRGSDRRGGAE